MRFWLPTITTAALLVAGPAQAQDPAGEWLVGDGSAHVRIVDCGDALWGVVSWTRKPGYDINNPDPDKRNRPTLGLPVLLHMRPTEPGHWEGQVYNAKNGSTYDAAMEVRGADTLHVEGCTFGILCGGEDWTRLTIAAAAPLASAICASIGAGRTHENRLEQHRRGQRADQRQRQKLAHARSARMIGEPQAAESSGGGERTKEHRPRQG